LFFFVTFIIVFADLLRPKRFSQKPRLKESNRISVREEKETSLVSREDNGKRRALDTTKIIVSSEPWRKTIFGDDGKNMAWSRKKRRKRKDQFDIKACKSSSSDEFGVKEKKKKNSTVLHLKKKGKFTCSPEVQKLLFLVFM